MKKLIVLLIPFMFSSCISTGQNIYVTHGHIETVDGRNFDFMSAEIFRDQWITVINEPEMTHRIDNEKIKYISLASYYVKRGLYFGKPYIKKQF